MNLVRRPYTQESLEWQRALTSPSVCRYDGLVVSSREYPADADVQHNPPTFTYRSDLPQQFMRVRAHPAFSPFQADDASSILVGRSVGKSQVQPDRFVPPLLREEPVVEQQTCNTEGRFLSHQG